jgi:CheY-like chemotaxis protein
MGVHEHGAEHEQPEHETQISRQILIVEDDEDTAAVLAEFLQLKGHSVRAVHDGASALETIRNEPIEIVLLDLGLPKMNGYEVARAIRREHGEAISLIALTGYQEDTDRLKEAGFDEHLLKPFDVDRLSERLASTRPK